MTNQGGESMKKILIVLLLSLTCASTQALATIFTVDHIKYSVISTTDNTVQVEGIDDNTITDLTIPGTVEYNGTNYQVTTIKGYSFNNNNVLKNVVVSEGITTIGYSAFGICSNLESISLPKTLSKFDTSTLCVFRECYNLKSIKVAEGNTALKVDECGVLYDYDMKNLIYCPPAIEKSKVKANYVVPSTVENICNYAFNKCPFTHVVLPSNLKKIGELAFLRSSDALHAELTIPANVTNIGSGVFNRSTIKSIFFLWDGTSSLPKNFTNFSGLTIYVKKSVYDNHIADLKNWSSSATFAYKIPINKAKTYSTLCRDFDVDLSNSETSTGIKAFYAASVSNGKVTLKEINYVPSRTGTNHDEYTGVIIKVASTNKDYYYQIGEKDYTSASQAPSLSGNLLVGAPAETFIDGPADDHMYGLYNGEFRRYSDQGFLAYNKAYLRLPESTAGAKRLSLSIEETPTGINEVSESKESDASYYTLSGTRLSGKPTHPGIYIHGGKKVVWTK
ncbi:MAG TPA: hypothetical protein DIS88_01370 [Prevotella sp.]|nr:hypothetical protein [Prevotella sp.]